MDLLYVVKGDSPDLRLSLRSVCRNGSNVGRLVVAGTGIPTWLTDDVVRVEVPSPFDRKQKNILYAILEAMRRGAVAGPSLYSSDDHYMLAPYDLDRFPWFARPTGYPPVPPKGANAYRMSIFTTGVMLAYAGLPCDLRVDGHWNTHVDPADLLAAERLLAGFERTRYGYEPSTPFVALARARGACPVVTIMPDRKVRPTADPRADYDGESRAHAGLLSAGDLTRMPRLRAWLEGKFPEPCRWEKA